MVRPPDKSGNVKQYLTRVIEERKGIESFPTKRETQLSANKDMIRESRKDRESMMTNESLNRIGQVRESLTFSTWSINRRPKTTLRKGRRRRQKKEQSSKQWNRKWI